MNQLSPLARVSPAPLRIPVAESALTTGRLAGEDEAEVLEFLARRPIHTVAMVGFIHDNGLVSPLNRGIFHGCRNRQGQLEGVALIGHATLMEARTDRALHAFVEVAQKCNMAHLIMGEEERILEFWTYYSKAGQEMRRACRELLFELRWPLKVREEGSELRRATLNDLDLIAPVQAQMAFDESAVNPMEADSAGFLQRCVRRINQGRTWTWIDDGKLIFKADIVADTPAVIYLEGIWVNPETRGRGYGLRCMSQLAQMLLSPNQSICLLVNGENTEAHQFYERAGYEFRGVYDTIFLK